MTQCSPTRFWLACGGFKDSFVLRALRVSHGFRLSDWDDREIVCAQLCWISGFPLWF